jgi:hypothetical protein
VDGEDGGGASRLIEGFGDRGQVYMSCDWWIWRPDAVSNHMINQLGALNHVEYIVPNA